jgi:hypothetical protein
MRQITRLLQRIGAPRPTRSRMTMTGSRFPGSRVVTFNHLPRIENDPSGINGRRLAAYSCGGSSGIVCCERRTVFPWLALAGTTVMKRDTGLHPRQQTIPKGGLEG